MGEHDPTKSHRGMKRERRRENEEELIMDRKNLYAPPSSIPDIRAGLRAGSKMGATQVQIPFSEKMAISLASGVIMAVCVMISQRLFGQMWIGVILGTLFSTKFLHSRFDQPKLAQVSEVEPAKRPFASHSETRSYNTEPLFSDTLSPRNSM
ncbi:unnamed protein product [Notodromas monacha]|uniref:Uncharacterized protein n=1 Tax=Notodromas monacha TaxID=399045 RepID=A0A7R9C029_9CRUS|nr:unnamed protein product [Notodromas monacha]CAG0923263.1 unnamed protein product [Notodromas monacha]